MEFIKKIIKTTNLLQTIKTTNLLQIVKTSKFWWIVGGILYSGWAYFYLKFVMQRTFNEEFRVFKNLSKEVKKKYFMYVRSECKYLDQRRLSMTLCGLTILPIRLILHTLSWICWSWTLRILWIGSDVTKPLSKWKYYLISRINKLWARYSLFTLGCWINYKKVRI